MSDSFAWATKECLTINEITAFTAMPAPHESIGCHSLDNSISHEHIAILDVLLRLSSVIVTKGAF